MPRFTDDVMGSYGRRDWLVAIFVTLGVVLIWFIVTDWLGPWGADMTLLLQSINSKTLNRHRAPITNIESSPVRDTSHIKTSY